MIILVGQILGNTERNKVQEISLLDILGDETVEHWQLVRNAPFWLRGFQGNELQHLLRRLKYQGKYLEENQPQRYSI